MKRKWIALALTCALGLCTLTGCGDSDTAADVNNDTQTKSQEENDDAAEENQDSEEVVTLKWIQVGSGMPNNYEAWLEQINPYLEEKIGVNVEMEIVSWADWDSRRSIIETSGEAFDILFTDSGRYLSEINTGIFMDITDMVKTETPDLYALMPEDYWDAVSVDGKIYGVPTYKDSSASIYFIWDKDVADKYDINIDEIADMQSLYTALKTIKDGEGTAPYRMSSSGADFLMYDYDGLGLGLPVIGVKVDDETRTVVNPLQDEDIIENLKLVRQMYVEGIINGNATTNDSDSTYRIFATAQGWSGAAASTWGPSWGIENCVAVQYGNTVLSNATVQGSINGIYSGCEHPEKALQLLELVNTDSKVRDMFYYGVEGDNFEYQDGYVNKLNEDWTMAGYTQGTFFNVTPLVDSGSNGWDEVKQLNENATGSVLLGFSVDATGLETEIANCNAVYAKYKAELWTGTADPEELLPKIISELETAGWQTIADEAQKQIDEAYGNE